MDRNYTFGNASQATFDLAHELNDAPEVGSRAGRTKELTHVGITLSRPLERELLVPGRVHNLAAQIAETVWVLSGRNDVEWLAHYLPRAADFSDDGETWRAGYGPSLRAWQGQVDQLDYVVRTLRTSPGSRQAVATLWDPMRDTHPGNDIACNNWLSFLSREGYLDLHVAVRSNDLMWGWSGINQFEWSVLLEIVASLTGLQVGQLHFSITSLHLYDRHWAKVAKLGQPLRADYTSEPPRFEGGKDMAVADLDGLFDEWFVVEAFIRKGRANQTMIDTFPEPMLRSWLKILDWWHNRVAPPNDRLGMSATGFALQPKANTLPEKIRGAFPSTAQVDSAARAMGESIKAAMTPAKPTFIDRAIALHNEKHAAYGDSWKRRGEMLGILANIARKIDRLGGAETSDETQADTAMDLMIYLAKYRAWLATTPYTAEADEHADHPANAVLQHVAWSMKQQSISVEPQAVEDTLRSLFDQLEAVVESKGSVELRQKMVSGMLEYAYGLALYRDWQAGNATRSWNPDA